MGVHPAGDDSSSIYTVAVDIWALGAIMFRLLNNRNAFGDPHRLARYVTAKGPFPRDGRLKQDVSRSCMEFLEHAMARSPKDRPTSHQALNHAWFGDLHDSASSPEALLEKLYVLFHARIYTISSDANKP
jgi:serine/threonine protein kinase